ncbi:MAG: FKBP-type peptidyl-prolyl cis-trans isomerase [Bacteroidales bacterium]|nr:FKBP-type peptidyl-prolyl cis-trans isomerase [Bacteroidales bacterium]
MMRHSLLVLFLCVFLFSCSSNSRQSNTKTNSQLSEQQLIAINRKLLENEKKNIDDFVKSKGWQMKTTSTGLRYMFVKHGTGPLAKTGQVATIAYTIRLMNGPVVYSSEQSGLKSFEIGHGGVVAGLEEGIILLKVGDKAKFILPSHLAYGLTGDSHKIPPHTPIIYTVELVNLN